MVHLLLFDGLPKLLQALLLHYIKMPTIITYSHLEAVSCAGEAAYEVCGLCCPLVHVLFGSPFQFARREAWSIAPISSPSGLCALPAVSRGHYRLHTHLEVGTCGVGAHIVGGSVREWISGSGVRKVAPCDWRRGFRGDMSAGNKDWVPPYTSP